MRFFSLGIAACLSAGITAAALTSLLAGCKPSTPPNSSAAAAILGRSRTLAFNSAGVFAIKADGGMLAWHLLPITAGGKVVNYKWDGPIGVPMTQTVDVAPGVPVLARRSDGTWWALEGTPRQISKSTVASGYAEGRPPFFWHLENGVATLVTGTARKPKAGSVLTGVVRVLASSGPQASPRAYLLRKDGTVWVDDAQRDVPGPVLSSGTHAAKPVAGLDHVADLAVCSHAGEPDTVVALCADGSIRYKGIQMLGVSSLDQMQTLLLPSGAAIRVAAGRGVGGAVDTAGNVWVWSKGHYLRASDTPDSADASKPVQIAGVSDVVDLDFSDTLPGYAAALTEDGKVWAWGDRLPAQKILDGIRVPK